MNSHFDFVPGLHIYPREGEAMRLAADGLSTKEAAREMDVAPCTVKAYLDRARLKLNARNVTHLVAIGFEKGLLVVKHAPHMAIAGIIAGFILGAAMHGTDLRSNARVTRTTRSTRTGRRTYDYLPPDLLDLLQPKEHTA